MDEHRGEQKQFLKQKIGPALEAAEKKVEQVYFVDAAHFVMGNFFLVDCVRRADERIHHSDGPFQGLVEQPVSLSELILSSKIAPDSSPVGLSHFLGPPNVTPSSN